MSIPVNDLKRHVAGFADEVRDVLTRVARSGWYVLGQELEAFEAAFAGYCGAQFAIGVGNGTDALELALRALDVQPGDKILTVANAGMYSTTAIRAVGAVPFFVDIDPATMLVSHDAFVAALRTKPRAAIVTHLYGRMAEMGAIGAAAHQAAIPVVEDCAQAHGASRNGLKAGTFGAIGCYSFYPTKNLGALGDGGALLTSDAILARRLRSLRQYGWSSKYTVELGGGRNSRLDEIQAAVLSVLLPRLDGWNARRRGIASMLSRGILHSAVRPAPEGGEEFVAHLYAVRTPARDSLRAHLKKRGIDTDIHYPIADHRQQPLADAYRDVRLPATETAAREVLTLPCFPEMTDDEVTQVIEACNDWQP